MHPRARQLITAFSLQVHPEGGFYREIHRSPLSVAPADGRPSRSALTVIYFLLVEGQVSHWHRVASDESWHFHEGDVLELLVADENFASTAVHRLGPWSDAGTEPVRVVPAGAWQAARTTGACTLVSCSVGPGFDFADFQLRSERSPSD
jgi:predicted cupin superfamily sugar epimerase